MTMMATTMTVMTMTTDAQPSATGDFNSDGTVGILDLLTLLSNWGPCA